MHKELKTFYGNKIEKKFAYFEPLNWHIEKLEQKSQQNEIA